MPSTVEQVVALILIQTVLQWMP